MGQSKRDTRVTTKEQDQQVNTKTLVRYRNNVPARVISKRIYNKRLQYKLDYKTLGGYSRYYLSKWRDAKDCTIVYKNSKFKKKLIRKYKITPTIQKFLWFLGIAVHNHDRNERTPDFNCCNSIGRKKWYLITNNNNKW